jgi:hypothetical protein
MVRLQLGALSGAQTVRADRGSGWSRASSNPAVASGFSVMGKFGFVGE